VQPARRRILDAAARRFAGAGVSATTLEEIRGDAHVSVGAVYHHFADKEGLAAAVWLDALGRYQRGFLDVLRAHPDARPGIAGAVRHHLAWVARHRDLAQILLGARPAGAVELNEPFFAEVRAWWRAHAH
jgi:AcrR family transcriptional regulator